MSDDITAMLRERIAALDEQIAPLVAERRRLAIRAGMDGVKLPRYGSDAQTVRDWVARRFGAFTLTDVRRETGVTVLNMPAYLRRIGAVRVRRGVYRRPDRVPEVGRKAEKGEQGS